MNTEQQSQIKKEELVELVKEWIDMDTEINKLNKSITTIKKQIEGCWEKPEDYVQYLKTFGSILCLELNAVTRMCSSNLKGMV
jgi:hypothetical protein